MAGGGIPSSYPWQIGGMIGRPRTAYSQNHGNPTQAAIGGPRAFTVATTASAGVTQSPYDAASEAAIENGGIAVGEILAWRVWSVRHGWLYSLTNSDYEWEPGQAKQAHTVSPVLGDGIHAFKTRKQAIEYVMPDGVGADRRGVITYVIGQVALWGEVIEFEQGWHAEFAAVHCIDWSYPNNPDELAELQRRYGIYGYMAQETPTGG